MTKGILGDREKALEDSYFRDQDSKLLQKLRQGAALDDIALALSEKLEVDNPELLLKARAAGITPDIAPAFLLAPLVQVAWAGESVTKAEREAVLKLARERGIETASPSYAQLEKWLDERPNEVLFETALDVMKVGFSVLPHAEKEERIKRVTDGCHTVAAASGSEIARLIGLGDGVSGSEQSLMQTITERLRGLD